MSQREYLDRGFEVLLEGWARLLGRSFADHMLHAGCMVVSPHKDAPCSTFALERCGAPFVKLASVFEK